MHTKKNAKVNNLYLGSILMPRFPSIFSADLFLEDVSPRTC